MCINFCICDETWKRDPNLETRQKRQKTLVEESESNGANLGNIVKHCPCIEELEIWGCQQYDKTISCFFFEVLHLLFCCRSWSSSIPSLKYIKDLKKLKFLSLIDIPLQVDGSFLVDVRIEILYENLLINVSFFLGLSIVHGIEQSQNFTIAFEYKNEYQCT